MINCRVQLAKGLAVWRINHPPHSRPSPKCPTLLCLLLTVLFTGCTQDSRWTMEPKTPALTVPDARPVSNIVSVNKFFSPVPWLIFEDQIHGKIDGFKCTVYLEGHDSAKGVFGTGTLVITMYHLGSSNEGKEQLNKVYEWVLPPDKARPWQARKPTMLGWGYGLRLHWGKKVDVAGKKIAIVIKYLRDDGHVISSSRKILRVPLANETNGRVSAAKPTHQPLV